MNILLAHICEAEKKVRKQINKGIELPVLQLKANFLPLGSVHYLWKGGGGGEVVQQNR